MVVGEQSSVDGERERKRERERERERAGISTLLPLTTLLGVARAGEASSLRVLDPLACSTIPELELA